MADRKDFSRWLLEQPAARNKAALARITIAKARIQNILDRDTVANQKTLEQKIAEQGPVPLRVDPHLIGLAIKDLRELNRLALHQHPAAPGKTWFANPGTAAARVTDKLVRIAPLHEMVSGHGFGNLTGDALEVIVYKCLEAERQKKPAYAYLGSFELDQPKRGGRFHRSAPPKIIGSKKSSLEADFFQFGHSPGPLCIECKNRREWIYPNDGAIDDLITLATDLDIAPVLVARRLHYTTRTNLLEPAGIIGHETYFQYYPSDKADLAALVKDKRSLGFTDVLATEEPHARTSTFFATTLPQIVEPMATKWNRNKAALRSYADGEINLPQLYDQIESPAAGNWQYFEED